MSTLDALVLALLGLFTLCVPLAALGAVVMIGQHLPSSSRRPPCRAFVGRRVSTPRWPTFF